ncbi:mRNA capping enzyme, catalytic domain-containing protein [Russula vinacea]|nr:mRNA capping enzyme, catalytic domain-containing protein [Russula vinacea]
MGQLVLALSYWVCEKSDGVRVLLFILTILETNEQSVYIIDRHNIYREIFGLYFPHHEHPERPLRSTVLDAELVIDVDPRTKRETPRLLCFDCLVADSLNVMSKTLDKRYGRLKEVFFKPFAKMLRDHPFMIEKQPFDIQVKEVNFSLKWKPPSENSIDFKLVLRFPPLPGSSTQPDLHAKPVFALHVWCGGEGAKATYEPWDTMHVSDDEWESLKANGEQIDDRIIEVCWDPDGEHWRMMRFRDDKPQGNHRSVVRMLFKALLMASKKMRWLLTRSATIKNAWKARHGQPVQQQPPPLPPSHNSNGPPLPPPPSFPTPYPQPQAMPRDVLPPLPLRYGPLAPSPWSKVSGPTMIAGVSR